MKKNNQYKKLSPNDTIKESYAFAPLDYALKSKEIFNIAITGAYGAGKSSIIKSYFKKFCKFQFLWKCRHPLYVSLASFCDKNKCEKNVFSQDEENSLEKCILQQLIYTKKSRSLKQSRFDRIAYIPIHEFFCYIIVMFFGMITFLKIGYPKELTNCMKIFFSKVFDFSVIPDYLYFAISFVFIFAAIQLILKMGLRLRFVKFNVGPSTIELYGKKDSILNKYIDDIIYFFEKTKHNIVVFEDLDRFNSTKIFVKLREVNKLLNDYKYVKRPIKFIYALNDDVFTGCDRVKFFDFIIPIIPVIDSKNIDDYANEIIRDSNSKQLKMIDKDLLANIGLYINDLRLFNNIQNEFITYFDANFEFKKKTKTSISAKVVTEIFALIVYKNLYPKDFKLNQRKEGILYNIFAKKESFLNKYNFEKKDQSIDKQISVQEIVKSYSSNYMKYLQKELDNNFDNDILTLLFDFIGCGYITEDYSNRISHVYAGELSRHDFDIVKAIRAFKSIEFQEKIENLDLFMKKIQNNVYWKSECILNKYILEYICGREDFTKINLFIEALVSHANRKKTESYFKIYPKDIFIKPVVDMIASKLNTIDLDLFFDDSNLDYFLMLLHAVKQKDVSKVSEIVTDFFSKYEEIFLSTFYVEILFKNFSLLNRYNIKINNLSLITNARYLSIVKKHCIYRITYNNISILLNNKKFHYYDVKNDFNMKKYVDEKINDYVDNVIFFENCVENEKDEDLFEIIFNPNLKKDRAYLIASKINNQVSDIEQLLHMYLGKDFDISKNLPNIFGFESLLENGKIVYTTKNKDYLKKYFNLDLKPFDEKKVIPTTIKECKKQFRNLQSDSEKAQFIVELFSNESVQKDSNMIDFALNYFLSIHELGTYLEFASQLVKENFIRVIESLDKRPPNTVSIDILTSRFIDEKMKKEMLQKISFPGSFVSFIASKRKKSKDLFIQEYKSFNTEMLSLIYTTIFNRNIPCTADAKIDNDKIIHQLLNAEWT